ncbi:hypothetical protein OIU78_011252 [Salix suchowensis]|nr:hypothetical protein OIU78_011252 [Salix suchowensis]
MEAQLGLDFSNLYKDSHLFQKNEDLVTRLGLPEQGSKELHFSTRFPQNAWQQFKACLWKQELSYWRSPKYNLVRLIFIIVSSLMFGALLWQKGQKIDDEQDIFNILGSIFIFIQKYPRWWVWGYWISPASWSLKGLLASQYGDIEEEITVYGERKSISSFLRSYFGYKHDDLGVAGIVLLAFPVFFALSYAMATAKLNFQKR